jgi:hypothetical protein
VENETLDDRALEGVWLGNDLSTPMFWMYSFKLRKVVRLSDPRHFDHILMMILLLLFLQKQSLAFAVYLFGIGTLHTGPGLKKKAHVIMLSP